jgi:hypothetical protein
MRARAFFMSLIVLLGWDSMSPGSLTAGDEPVLELIPGLTALERYQLKPLPASLEAVRRIHPRLEWHQTKD